MKVGLMGAGHVARTLGKLLAKGSHSVLYGGRSWQVSVWAGELHGAPRCSVLLAAGGG